MSRYFELAEKIYEALLAKGAGIGNASIPIIIKVLEENEAVEHSVQSDGEACPDDRHMYYIEFLNYIFCPYCSQRLHRR